MTDHRTLNEFAVEHLAGLAASARHAFDPREVADPLTLLEHDRVCRWVAADPLHVAAFVTMCWALLAAAREIADSAVEDRDESNDGDAFLRACVELVHRKFADDR
jgi:hypothetical protein